MDMSSEMRASSVAQRHIQFVHSRFLAETFGMKVEYDEATRTVHFVHASGADSVKPASKTYYINIEGFLFKGGNMTVEAGSTIVFTNKDKVKHNAVAANGSFKLPLLATGESASITLTEPGDYAYFCESHKNAMQGTITVKSWSDSCTFVHVALSQTAGSKMPVYKENQQNIYIALHYVLF